MSARDALKGDDVREKDNVFMESPQSSEVVDDHDHGKLAWTVVSARDEGA
jgi:hypothetical protein